MKGKYQQCYQCCATIARENWTGQWAVHLMPL